MQLYMVMMGEINPSEVYKDHVSENGARGKVVG
jgi:hypothetical protein